jgi:hypothetical protein
VADAEVSEERTASDDSERRDTNTHHALCEAVGKQGRRADGLTLYGCRTQDARLMKHR